MKKENWALVLSGIAIAISIIALCISCPHKAELGFDYQGVLVGVLSLLVTILIGWNIYTIIDIKTQEIRLMKYQLEHHSWYKKTWQFLKTPTG